MVGRRYRSWEAKQEWHATLIACVSLHKQAWRPGIDIRLLPFVTLGKSAESLNSMHVCIQVAGVHGEVFPRVPQECDVFR